MAQEPAVTKFQAPLYVAWEITHLCNAACIHCYSASGPDASRCGELDEAEALNVVDQISESGVLVLALSGGEPLLRRDWPNLVERGVSSGLRVNVGTNGSTITPSTADQLASLGVHSVTVSLDSHRPEVHDRFRGFSGLFPRTLRAIRLLVEQNIRVVVGFTPTRLNWQDGPDVVELARKLGATAVNLSEYVPAGRGTLDLALAPEQLRDVLETWIHLRDEHQGSLDILWHDCRVGMLVPEHEKRNYVGCGAGRLVARILPDGTVTPCVFLPTPIGSLRKESFQSLWKRSSLLAQFRERSGHISGNCGTCRHLSTCGGCRAVAYAYSGGNPLAGDPHCWLEPDTRVRLLGLTRGEALPI